MSYNPSQNIFRQVYDMDVLWMFNSLFLANLIATFYF